MPLRTLPSTVLLAALLVPLILSDLRSFRLPDRLTLPLVAIGLLTALLLPEPDPLAHVAGAIAGFSIIVGLGAGYQWLRGREGIGGGDAKLLAAGGAWLGVSALPALLLVAAMAGIGWALVSRRRRRDPAGIPFGVPLSVGIWLLWLYGVPGG